MKIKTSQGNACAFLETISPKSTSSPADDAALFRQLGCEDFDLLDNRLLR